MTGYLCFSVSVWIFQGFSRESLDFENPHNNVWICLVFRSGFVLSPVQLKQANFRSSGGQLEKETSNTSTAQLIESLRTTTVP